MSVESITRAKYFVKMIQLQLLFTTFAILVASGSTFPFENSIKWVSAPNSQVLLLNQNPAGYESGMHLFLCRTTYEGSTIPGKLLLKGDGVSCVVPFRGGDYNSTNFQVLVSYPASISWKAYKGTSDSNMISSGKINGEQSYVCRAHVDNNLIPGRLSPSTKTCIMAFNGMEYSRSENIEYLGRNYLGITMQNSMPS